MYKYLAAHADGSIDPLHHASRRLRIARFVPAPAPRATQPTDYPFPRLVGGLPSGTESKLRCCSGGYLLECRIHELRIPATLVDFERH
ncbi:hypothetical protein LY78DRAFT_664203 [Colletotrichum sublineola]|nr:hypothetical protein LY78DRAFT_664203 [Colletotrichum sublineola]